MIRGSCLCGGVAFALDGDVRFMSHCHCSMCRKAHGADFSTVAHGGLAEFHWVRGEDLVTHYESSPGNRRAFCRVCGSNLPSTHAAVDHVGMPAGTLDDDPGVRPWLHICTASKAPWVDITDDLPRFDALPPGWNAWQERD